MKTCTRCGQEQQPSFVAAALVHFVCDACRLDNKDFAQETAEHRKEFSLGLDNPEETC